jgi:predicted ArsR family transcriptional regulator
VSTVIIPRPRARELDVALERDGFLRTLVRELAGTLEEVVGIDDASGYISVVGTAMGEEISREYRRAFRVDALTREQVVDVLVDLKRRIRGDFYVVEQAEDKVVLGNRTCPFAEKVVGRRSICMMTSNVFGHLAAENLGYGKVELQRTIAEGHPECRVVIYFARSDEAAAASGREYVRSSRS